MAGFDMAAGMYGMFPNIYNNQVALNDLTDMDLYSPIGMVNPMMSMNGSISGGGLGGFGGFGGYLVCRDLQAEAIITKITTKIMKNIRTL